MNDRLGPTGKFPEGKLNERDMGALRFAVGHENNKVVINFGTPVEFVGFSAKQAVEIAELLVKHARHVARSTGEVITVRL